MIRSTVLRLFGRKPTNPYPTALLGSAEVENHQAKAIRRYLSGNREPFSEGYTEYKERLVLETLNNPALMETFRTGAALPMRFGDRLDERIVEYPWVFSRLQPGSGLVIDAGSTFNKASLLACDALKNRSILIYTLATDWITYDPRISYLFGDLRNMILKDEVAQTVVCISTLEHVGFTYEYNTYSRRNPWPHAEPESYLEAVREFRRVLTPGGRLLLTIPYGRYEDHGWLQQFDDSRVESVKSNFGGTVRAEVYYRYSPDGWRTANALECRDLAYFNIHETGQFEEDGVAAARAVCCLDLER
jgi:SAM-dependent methyltransferase